MYFSSDKNLEQSVVVFTGIVLNNKTKFDLSALVQTFNGLGNYVETCDGCRPRALPISHFKDTTLMVVSFVASFNSQRSKQSIPA